MLAHALNLMWVAGDMINSGNALYDWHNYWFKPLEFQNIAQTRPALFARGNHDGEHALELRLQHAARQRILVCLRLRQQPFHLPRQRSPHQHSSDQYNWLQAELSRPETQQAAFRIVCFHKPPYVNLWNGGGYTGEDLVRNDWVPLFTQKNVDIVISGHSTAYQRGATNGVVYVVSGGGGGALDTEVVAYWPFVQVEYSQYHFDIMKINGATLSWETYNASNQLLDMFTLPSRVPVVGWQTTAPVGGALMLTVAGKPGTSYALESSTNLVNWTAFVTNTIPASGPPMFTNPVAVDSSFRSFRARTSQ